MSIVTYIKDKLGVKHEIGAKWENVSGKPFTSVDSALSSTSTNPVQNKVVNTALAGKMEYKHSRIAIQSAVTDTTKRYWLAAYQTTTHTGNYNQSARFSLFQRGTETETNRIDFSINCRSSATAIGSVGVRIENSVGLDSSTAEKMFYVTTEISGNTKTIRIYIDRTHNANYSWTTFTLQGLSFPYSDYGLSFASASNFIFSADATVSGSNYGTCVDTMVGNVVATTHENLYHSHSNYIPFQKKSIYGCRVKRLKTGGNWYDNDGFQIVESYASSFRTHWVTFRWDSAAQMNGTTGRGCRRFLFGYEETGRFLRCFVSEDDTYWYVWILFMNAKTGGTPGANSSSVMQMQVVPNGLEILTAAPDLTNLTEIPWAADERYLSQNGTAKKALALCRNNTVRQSSIDLSHESGGDGNALTRVDLLTGAVASRPGDGFVATFNWDTTAPYDTQLYIPNASTANNGIPKIRFRDNKSAWGAWGELNIGGNAATASKAATINIGAKDGNWRDILASFDGATSVYRTYLRSYADSNNGTILEIGREKNDNTKGSQIRLIRYDASGNQLIGIIRNSTITENRNWEFPNASGTLALTSDLSSYATKVELNAKQDDISDMIPTAASASNPLCDKAYADAIGERLEARYLGCNANGDPFATHAALTSATKFYYQGAETTPDTNDITTVVADEDHKNTSNVAGTTRYRYGGVDASGKPVWAFEYVINNTGLSQAQLLAVNSGITATKVTKYEGYATGKQDKLTEMTEQEVTDLINSLEA